MDTMATKKSRTTRGEAVPQQDASAIFHQLLGEVQELGEMHEVGFSICLFVHKLFNLMDNLSDAQIGELVHLHLADDICRFITCALVYSPEDVVRAKRLMALPEAKCLLSLRESREATWARVLVCLDVPNPLDLLIQFTGDEPDKKTVFCAFHDTKETLSLLMNSHFSDPLVEFERATHTTAFSDAAAWVGIPVDMILDKFEVSTILRLRAKTLRAAPDLADFRLIHEVASDHNGEVAILLARKLATMAPRLWMTFDAAPFIADLEMDILRFLVDTQTFHTYLHISPVIMESPENLAHLIDAITRELSSDASFHARPLRRRILRELTELAPISVVVSAWEMDEKFMAWNEKIEAKLRSGGSPVDVARETNHSLPIGLAPALLYHPQNPDSCYFKPIHGAMAQSMDPLELESLKLAAERLGREKTKHTVPEAGTQALLSWWTDAKTDLEIKKQAVWGVFVKLPAIPDVMSIIRQIPSILSLRWTNVLEEGVKQEFLAVGTLKRLTKQALTANSDAQCLEMVKKFLAMPKSDELVLSQIECASKLEVAEVEEEREEEEEEEEDD